MHLRTEKIPGERPADSVIREILSSVSADFFYGFDAVILSVSGGADSMFLLHVFLRLRESGILPAGFEVFHLNHCIREDAYRDEELIISECRRNNILYEIYKKNILKLSRKIRRGTEETGRMMRYRLLGKMAQKRGNTLVVTAHHSDDYAESVLFFMIRGGGRSIFGTMPLIAAGPGFTLFRPLLFTDKESIRKAVALEGIPWNEDYTNQDKAYTRNRIRSDIMPLLKKEGFSPVMLWRNHHESADFFIPGNDVRTDIIYLPPVFFEGVSVSAVKYALDLALKRAGFNPVTRDLLNEIRLQLSRGSSFSAETSEYFLWFRKNAGFYLISRKSPALLSPVWTVDFAAENRIRIKIVYNKNERTYVYHGKAGDYYPGLREYGRKACTAEGGRNLSDVFSQSGFPVYVRKNIPVIYNSQGCAVRICGSLFDGRADRIFT